MEKGKLYKSNTTETIVKCTEYIGGDYFMGYVVKEGIDAPFRLGLSSDSWGKENFTECILPPLSNQVGGNHYKDCKIQPTEFIHANNIPFIEGNIIKYVIRHKSKNGLEDLKKARHYIDLLIEFEYESKKDI
jgi:hypothetical protein